MTLQSDIVIPKSMEEACDLYNTAYSEEGGMVLLSICDSGSFSIRLSGKKYRISTGDILILPPGVNLGASDADKGNSKDIKYLGVKYKSFLESIRTGRNVWSILMYARSNPVFHLSDQDRELTSNYYRVIEGKLRTPRGFYYDEIIRALLQCVIYELCVILNRDLVMAEDRNVRSKDVIFKKFMEMLAESGGRERSLKHYVDALFVTPKYLSAVTNDVCGISAHELILNNVASHIRQELEFSTTGIKELSVQFGFPNMSSFGKFVKIRLGKSPRAFRKEK